MKTNKQTSKIETDRLNTTVPLYVQIAESLFEQIESGELSPEERLPSERELSKTLNVSRMTVRAALRILDSKGLLNRRSGDGTYIAKPKIERQAGKLAPFTKSMSTSGHKPSAKIIAFETRMAEVSVANDLKILVSSPVYYVLRLRFINQEPVMLEKFFTPFYRFPNLEQHDLETRSFYEIAETEYGVVAHHSQQSLEAVAATEFEADLLDVSLGAPMMLERRLAFDKENTPFECGHDIYQGNRFRFITEIAPLEMK